MNNKTEAQHRADEHLRRHKMAAGEHQLRSFVLATAVAIYSIVATAILIAVYLRP